MYGCWTGGWWSSWCRQPRGTSVSITTLWSTERACRSCYSTVPLHVKQLGKRLPLHPSLIGKTSSSAAESSLAYYPDYCLTWRLSHYLRHVSRFLPAFSNPPSTFLSHLLSCSSTWRSLFVSPCQDCPFMYLMSKDTKLKKCIHIITSPMIPYMRLPLIPSSVCKS